MFSKFRTFRISRTKKNKIYLQICSYIQKMTLNLIETLKTSTYSPKHINNTKMDFIFRESIFHKYNSKEKNKQRNHLQHGSCSSAVTEMATIDQRKSGPVIGWTECRARMDETTTTACDFSGASKPRTTPCMGWFATTASGRDGLG